MPRLGEEILKDTELRLVSELMKDSRRSDRELARVLGISQPTVGRMIRRLEKDGVINEYTMIPDLGRLGIEIMAFTFGVWSPGKLVEYFDVERVEKAKRFISEHPNVVFASSGLGLGMARMIVTIHKDYSDYAEFMRQARAEWAGVLTKLESFIISVKADVVTMPFSLGNLMNYIRNEEKLLRVEPST